MDAAIIQNFFQSNTRAENDTTNRQRESALSLIGNPDHEFFHNPVYGEKWKKVRAEFITYATKYLGIPEFSNFSLTHRGGQSNHHDFDFIIYDENGQSIYPVTTLEFKNNSMPQFMQEFDKNGWTEAQLAEFWYDEGWLDRIIALYEGHLKFEKPSREEYLQGTHKMMTKKFPDSFFKQFYDFDHDPRFASQTKQKARLSKEGIAAFLNEYGYSFYVGKLRNKCQAEQTTKIYFIWSINDEKFSYYKNTVEELSPSRIVKVTANKVILEAGPSEMHCLLRWKNSLGICCPAWQISMKKL
jgi:hypothetical protein